MFKNVLAATAMPLECDKSVLSASRIAQYDNAKLLILHVLEADAANDPNYFKHYGNGEEIVGDESYHIETKEKIDTIVS